MVKSLPYAATNTAQEVSRVRSRNLGTVDLDTGELLDGVPVWIGKKLRSPYGRRWYMANQEALELLATDPDMTGKTYRVLLYLFSRLDFENYIQVPQQEIAEALGMHKSHVSRSVRQLLDKGILLRAPDAGTLYAFRLNPYYGWKGRVSNIHRAPASRRTEHDLG